MSDLQTSRAQIPAPPASVPSVEGERKRPERPCTNCGDATVGNFCPVCGQRKVEVRVSLRRMLMEALDDQFSFNSALPRTLGALLFHPGRLTREYVSGRIARYIPPVRLYLVSSLAFFLLLSLSPGLQVDTTVSPDADGPNLQVSLNLPGDSARPAAGARRDSLNAAVAAELARRGGSWTDVIDVNTGWAALDQAFEAKKKALGQIPPREALGRLIREYMDHVPQMMFLLMPVFALTLKLFYLRKKRFYVEHFVHALHLHSFVYLLYTLLFILRWEPVILAAFAWLGIYVFLSLKRVYGQGWIMTGVKYVAIGFTYLFVLILAGVATLMATVLLM